MPNVARLSGEKDASMVPIMLRRNNLQVSYRFVQTGDLTIMSKRPPRRFPQQCTSGTLDQFLAAISSITLAHLSCFHTSLPLLPQRYLASTAIPSM
jgi:hypothetical protein